MNDMYSCVFCAKPGAGKSYSSLQLAWLLDRDVDDVPRFSIDRVCFTASDFAHWLAKGSSLPKGTVIILDDAGLVLYSKQTMQKVCVELGKAFQSMRYKNLIVILNLPSYKMLEAHVRKLLYDYIEVVGRIIRRNENIAKIHALQLNPFENEIYRHNIGYVVKEKHLGLGVPIYHEVNDYFRFKKPPTKLWKAYEKKKKEYLDEWSAKSYKKLLEVEQGNVEVRKEKKPTVFELYEEAKKHLNEIINKNTGKVSRALITTAKWYKGSQYMANILATKLNNEIGVSYKK